MGFDCFSSNNHGLQRQVVEQQAADMKKLDATIQEAEQERQNQRKEFEARFEKGF